MRIAEWLSIQMALIASSLSMFGPSMVGIASQLLAFNTPMSNTIAIMAIVSNIILVMVIKKIPFVSRGVQTLLALTSVFVFLLTVWMTYAFFNLKVESAYNLNLYLTSFMLAIVSPAATGYCIYKESLYTYLSR